MGINLGKLGCLSRYVVVKFKVMIRVERYRWGQGRVGRVVCLCLGGIEIMDVNNCLKKERELRKGLEEILCFILRVRQRRMSL